MVDYLTMLFNEFKSKYNSINEDIIPKEILSKQYITKLGNVHYFCFLPKNDFNYLKAFKVYGFWSDLLVDSPIPRDYFEMEVGVKFLCSGYPIEIKKIHAGINKRTGKGSAGIDFLETTVIPEINNILSNNHHVNGKITYIYGISADLSPDTDRLSRAKFYSKNGFILNNSHFYKYL